MAWGSVGHASNAIAVVAAEPKMQPSPMSRKCLVLDYQHYSVPVPVAQLIATIENISIS